MSEFEDKLNTILSSPETMQQLASIARTLSGETPEPGPEAKEEAPTGGNPLDGLLSGIDPGVIGRLLPLLSRYQEGSTEKIALLQAMKPFLRQERQEKLERAIQITRLSKLIRSSLTLLGEGEGHV